MSPCKQNVLASTFRRSTLGRFWTLVVLCSNGLWMGPLCFLFLFFSLFFLLSSRISALDFTLWCSNAANEKRQWKERWFRYEPISNITKVIFAKAGWGRAWRTWTNFFMILCFVRKLHRAPLKQTSFSWLSSSGHQMLILWLPFCHFVIQMLCCTVVVCWLQRWCGHFVGQLLWLFDVVVGTVTDRCYIQ